MHFPRALLPFAATVALWAATDGLYAFLGAPMPLALGLGFDFLAGVSLLSWYRADAERRSLPRSTPLGGAIVLLWVLAVPFYLWRSRAGGEKWRMLLTAIGAGVLFWLAFLLANLPAALRHAR